MSDPLDLTGRTAIVTGGTKGLGRVIATTLLEYGAEVIVCARNAPDTPVTANGREAHFVAADVRDAEQVGAVVDAAVERFKRDVRSAPKPTDAERFTGTDGAVRRVVGDTFANDVLRVSSSTLRPTGRTAHVSRPSAAGGASACT